MLVLVTARRFRGFSQTQFRGSFAFSSSVWENSNTLSQNFPNILNHRKTTGVIHKGVHSWDFYSTRTHSSEEQKIVVPQMGDSITEGTLEKFLKFPGDKVKVDEIVAQIETDKVTLDVRSTSSGEICTLKVSEGDTVTIGQEIMSYIANLDQDSPKHLNGSSVETESVSVKKPDISLIVPTMGDSISEGIIAALCAKPGKRVIKDELIAQIETDKVTIDVRSPEDGLLLMYNVEDGKTVFTGDIIAVIRPGSTSQDSPVEIEINSGDIPTAGMPPISSLDSSQRESLSEAPHEKRVKMSRLRMRVGERLKSAQNTYAMLTTFNEIDMTNLINMRKKFKDQFQAKYGDKLGFMSSFVAASARALLVEKNVNAVIESDEIVFKKFVDISVAVSSPKGLVVPVLRSADKMSFAQIEHEIGRYARKAADGSLSIDEMTGGTFTISNGGTFGSLSGTPIINPPQSAILGMHSIVYRPVCIGPENLIIARPMMNVALTYDHRLIDGREAVSFLRIIKNNVENPLQMLTEI